MSVMVSTDAHLQTPGGRSRLSAHCCATLGTSSGGAAAHETHTGIHTDILTTSAVDHPEEREARLTTCLRYSTAQQQEERTLENQWLTAGFMHPIFITNLFSTRG